MKTTYIQQIENKKLIARDRVLLYTRGMDMDLEDGVALALESMRRAGKEAEPGKVMEELFGILQERRHSPVMAKADGLPLACSPCLNRRTVLPNDMTPLSLTTAIMQWLRSLTGKTLEKRKTRHDR